LFRKANKNKLMANNASLANRLICEWNKLIANKLIANNVPIKSGLANRRIRELIITI